MIYKIVAINIVFLSIVMNGNGQSAHKYLRKGDGSYKKQDYTTAEENYRKALEKEQTVQGSYNLGNTIYQQKRYEEAIKRYEEAAENAKEPAAKALAYHNLGNAHFNMADYEKSVDAFKNALRHAPKDVETKLNLALAQRKLQQQQNQEQEQQQKEQEQQEEPQQSPPDSPQQQNQQQPQQGESQASAEEGKDLNQKEAQDLLEIVNREEQKVQQKLRKAQSKGAKPQKDW